MLARDVVGLRAPMGTLLWETALREAGQRYHDYVGTEHLLMALSRADGGFAARLLDRLKLDPGELRALLRARAGVGSSRLYSGHLPRPTPRLRHALLDTQTAMAQQGGATLQGLGERELLLALLDGGPGLAVRVLEEHGATAKEMQQWVQDDTGPEAARLRHPGEDAQRPLQSQDAEQARRADIIAAGANGTSALAKYGRDLVAEARGGGLHEVIGRQRELVEIVKALARHDRNVPVLVGDAGVGKTAIVEGLAWRLAQERAVIPVLRGKRIIALSMMDLEAGANYRGEFEERVQQILRECAQHPEIVLFIDELHTIVGAGHSGSGHDAAQLFKPALASGRLRLIGATTPEEYDRHLAADPALERRLQPIRVEELSEEETRTLLGEVAPRYEREHGVTILPGALDAAVTLSVRYLPERRLPDKALELVDSACASLVVGDRLSFGGDVGVLAVLDDGSALAGENAHDDPGNALDHPLVTKDLVASEVSERLGIPLGEITATDKDRLLNLPNTLRQHVIAQDDAIDTVTQALRIGRAGLRDANRPRAVLFFAGPTGVGKTELAKALAEALFGTSSERHFLRLDMAEYAAEHQVAQLIGAPPGYVGYEREGHLSGWLRHHPYSVVLFDEIEKAHPRVHTLLLGLFDAGRITDAQNRAVNGREAIFIVTSNLITRAPEPGSASSSHMGFFQRKQVPNTKRDAKRAQSEDERQTERALRDGLRKAMPHEWVNRLDSVVFFHPLEPEALKRIALLRLHRLAQQLDQAQGVTLEVDKAAQDWLVVHGTDNESGARELARVIDRELTSKIADLEVQGRLWPGVTLRVTVKDDQIHVPVPRPRQRG